MYDLLCSFIAVLDEFGVPHGRAKKAALCAAEGLMIVRMRSRHFLPSCH
jgi:nuclear cap-binding protein subunit 1